MSGNDFCKKYLELDENIPYVHLFQYPNCNKNNPDGKYVKILPLARIPNLNNFPYQGTPFGNNNNGSIVIPAPLSVNAYNKTYYDTKTGNIDKYEGPKIYYNFPGGKDGVSNNELKSITTTLNKKTSLYDNYGYVDTYGKFNYIPYWDSFRSRCCANENNPGFCSLYNPSNKNNICDYFIDDYYKRRKYTENIGKFCSLDKNQMSSPCDQIMANYCNTTTGKKDKLCSCFNSPFNVIKGLPFCIDKNCISHGYKNELAKEPCNITESGCKQITKIGKEGNQNIIDENKFKLYCSTDTNGTNGDGKNGNGTNGTDSFFEKYKTVIYVVLIFVAVFIIGTVIWLARRRIT
jgi:hypothetical protein